MPKLLLIICQNYKVISNSLLIMMIYFLLSCENQGSNIPSSAEFKKTMKMQVNGLNGVGTLVVPKSSKYSIVLNLDEKAELVKLSTCHREITIEKSGWTGRREQKFEFSPAVPIENEGYCPIFIGAFDLQGQHSWGIIEIRNRKLEATLYCNGRTSNEVGVSICQSKNGLLQRIIFNNKVDFEPVNQCGNVVTTDNKTFDISMTNGICPVVFYDRSLGKFHRLTLFGYTDVMLKSIESENQFPFED